MLVERAGKEGWAVAGADGVTVAIETAVDDELALEGRVYELIHRVNSMRKDAGLELTDRITLTLPARRRRPARALGVDRARDPGAERRHRRDRRAEDRRCLRPQPALSYIVRADEWPLVAEVAESLARQDTSDGIELLVVSRREIEVPPAAPAPAVRVIVDPTPASWAASLARGVRASAAEFVALGETHVLLAPDVGERGSRAPPAGADVVLPLMVNGNPGSALSEAAFVMDYRREALAEAASVPADLVYGVCLSEHEGIDVGAGIVAQAAGALGYLLEVLSNHPARV